MYGSALMAYLHHLAAFTVVAALGVEVALFHPPLTLMSARRLIRTDMVFGASATAVLLIGLLRVFYFEKGPAYYWHDSFFLLKFISFVAAALISIYPTLTFMAWNKGVKAGNVPQVDPARTRNVRLCLMLELTAVGLILLGAAFMARGFGYRP